MSDETESPAGATPPQQTVWVSYLHRPWVGPAIASAVALLVLLILLIPGILLYPNDLASGPSEGDLDAQRAHNEALEARILALQGALDTGVCIADGQYQVPPVYGPDGELLGDPEERERQQASLDDVLPPPPARQSVPDETEDGAETPEDPTSPDTGNTAPRETRSLLDIIDAATVLVVSPTGHGTGFFITDTLILTNRHVADQPVGTEVYVANEGLGQVQRATIRAATPQVTEMGNPDFAVLELASGRGTARLPFAATPERLVQVVAGGFPGLVVSSDSRFQRLMDGDLSAMPSPSVTEGVITTVQDSAVAEVALHTAQITPGNSGGPLVDRCGRLVGMNTFVRGEETTGGRINAALTTRSVIAFLNESGISAPTVASDSCGGAPAPAPSPATPESTPEETTPEDEN